jgi:hypothetical protein
LTEYRALLRQILMLDQLLAERGTTQYAVALTQKPAKPLTASRWQQMLSRAIRRYI